jgi:uncharacterized cupin superfamily protein
MSQPGFLAATPDLIELQLAPITPEWILSGAPQARSREVSRSADGASNTMIWDCTAGTFRWYFGVDETVHIIDGEVFVKDDMGNSRLLRAGDVGFFPAGTWMTWRVDNYVRKVAFLRHPLPQPFGALLRVFNYGLNVLRLKLRRPASHAATG